MWRSLFASKKFIAMTVGLAAVVVATILKQCGVAIPEDKIAELLGLIAVYILGQGIADNGKEAASIIVAQAAQSAAKPDANGTTDKNPTMPA